MKSILRVITAVAGTTVVSLLASLSFADLALNLSADICAPVNVGKANRVIQNFRGTILNSSTDETIAVSCPVITEFESVRAIILAEGKNDAVVAQDIRCVIRQLNFRNVVLQTLTRTETIPAGSDAQLFFETIDLLESDSRLNITCSLPPLTSIGLLGQDSFDS